MKLKPTTKSLTNPTTGNPHLQLLWSIYPKDLLNLLQISPNTLKSWEEKGLKRLEPPIEGTRTVYYKLENVLQFLEK